MTTIKNINSQIIKVTTIVALTLGSLYIKANNGLNETAAETQKTIKEHVKFPKFIMPIQKSEKVEVVFTTAENGKVNFVLAKTENKIIKTEIEKQFQELTLNKLKANVAYSIVFNFKTI
jgi:membrane-bound lytic murein transglycosylase MltF